uniref:Uncharacterized protein n=1 Tax=Craspedostauros australis TaxID=1486917 RepID=A0A7R9WTW2_9STRA|mmetsp:Transcript_17594/g.48841  ORF Transcript_17594/g.48841 Transcript_17594/m.48841 type:complete len:210 (+) Transcript_17594:289-918(+)|eukprot:CAMPEP_0198132890 /NCGR_PEP_ID=MMETSP1442-20131203/59284_1 /TAXON_ID= /ORGANISM="Craspedostauros australis, Strain CCMP3328" /LENGTH=209 /DNA_ID=CAMNT_0043793993 /DNA_START=1010 /DNA_END=1639 /DNA_ORIENTATION=-
MNIITVASTIARRRLVLRQLPSIAFSRCVAVGGNSITFADATIAAWKHEPQTHMQYHTTAPHCQAIRRRRRRVKEDLSSAGSSGEGGVRENPLKHEPITDPSQFRQSAGQLMQKLETALRPMQAVNDVFEITSTPPSLFRIDLAPVHGSYMLEFHVDESTMEYTSPISGKVLYVLSAKTGEWVGIEDGHVFEGILVGDLIRQCKGLPNL